jgi:hypothetical protein
MPLAEVVWYEFIELGHIPSNVSLLKAIELALAASFKANKV